MRMQMYKERIEILVGEVVIRNPLYLLNERISLIKTMIIHRLLLIPLNISQTTVHNQEASRLSCPYCSRRRRRCVPVGAVYFGSYVCRNINAVENERQPVY